MNEINIKQYNAVVRQNQNYRNVLTYIKNAQPYNYKTFKYMVKDLQFKAEDALTNK